VFLYGKALIKPFSGGSLTTFGESLSICYRLGGREAEVWGHFLGLGRAGKKARK